MKGGEPEEGSEDVESGGGLVKKRGVGKDEEGSGGRARKKEKTLTERAAARQGLLCRARPAGRNEAPNPDFSFSAPYITFLFR